VHLLCFLLCNYFVFFCAITNIILDAGRIADFLLSRKDLLAMLNYPLLSEKHQAAPVDSKIFNILTTRHKFGEVKDVLLLLHGNR
jgi:hypothetical protein